MQRIAILGAGAIGSVLGAFLVRNGQEVMLIGRPEQTRAIRENGLRVEGVSGSFTVHPAAAETLDFQPDLVFLTVKTQDVLPTLENARPFLSGVPLVTFQNGVRSDEMAATLVPREQILSAVVNISASYLTPGTVTIVYPGSLVVGRPFGPADRQTEAVAALLGAAAPTKVSRNIQGAHWMKLLVNLNNAFPALTNLPLSQVYADGYLRGLAVRVIREGERVMQRAGIRLESLPDAPVELIRVMTRLPIRLAGSLLANRVRRVEGEWPMLGSTLQSLRRGRPTEIDYLNGEVVRLGLSQPMPTPLNAAIVEMVHETERTGQFWKGEAVRKRLGEG